MNTGIRTVIESVVNDKTQAGALFTAHDITLEIRKRGHKAPHNDVRDAVHDYYDRGGMGVAYTRSTIIVPLGGTPFLYHRLVDDPSGYSDIRGQGQVPNPSTPTIAVPNPSSITNTSDDEDDEDDSSIPVPPSMVTTVRGVSGKKSRMQNFLRVSGRTVDGRKTLSVPTTLVRRVGFKPGDVLWACGYGNRIEITKQSPGHQAQTHTKYTVDSCGQIRITQYSLKRAGIGGNSYDLDTETNKIVVKLH